MKSPIAFLLVALVGATACTDSAIVPLGPKPLVDVAAASFPPPPPVTGELGGSFSVSSDAAASRSSGLTALNFDLSGGTTPLHHTFSQTAIFNKDLSTGISSIQMRNHLAIWVSDAGQSVGHGTIIEVDSDRNIWTIDLSQIHSATGGQLLSCASNTAHGEYCVQLPQGLVASVATFHGLDGSGVPVYDAPIHTAPSTLSFNWHVTTN